MKELKMDMERVIDSLRKMVGEAVLIHHDEADGVCSAALVKVALEKMGYMVKTICLDKLFPEVLEKILSSHRVTVFTDIGSAHVRKIEELTGEENLTVIIDHHDTVPSLKNNVFNINPELYGYKGERDASASTVAYLFAKSFDEKLSRLAYLAMVGSVEIPGEPSGLNKLVIEDALRESVVEKSGKEFKVNVEGFMLSRIRASQILTILASVGYYRSGVEKALESCTRGFTPEVLKFSEKLEEERKKANKSLLATLAKKGLNKTENVQWFDSGGIFKNMGSKVLGSFTSYLSYQSLVDSDKYLIGFMKISREIPGYGLLKKDYVKVSARAPSGLRRMIDEGVKPPLSKILPEACDKHGGFGDGHSVAASGVIPVGVEVDFIETFNKLVD
ncbi:MAG: DHH family phosphoesterase [Crenarchaeota archaeon]|nr:DHH family phosphoesterase [Thermoproteota archaeon]MDW8034502.1 DHH family phosphoesterase [Nitrososphaerota archaeon]